MIGAVIFDLDGTLVQTEMLVVTTDFTHKAIDESKLMEDRRICQIPASGLKLLNSYFRKRRKKLEI